MKAAAEKQILSWMNWDTNDTTESLPTPSPTTLPTHQKRTYTPRARVLSDPPSHSHQKARRKCTYESVAHDLAQPCCNNAQCRQHNFTLQQAYDIRNETFQHPTERDILEHIKLQLKNMLVKVKTAGVWVVRKQLFALRVLGSSVCPERFALLMGVSMRKIYHAVEHLHQSVETTPAYRKDPLKQLKKDTAELILGEQFAMLANEYYIDEGKLVYILYGFESRTAFWEHLMEQQIMLLDGSIFHISKDWFCAVWNKAYPDVYLASEKPKCGICEHYNTALQSTELSDIQRTSIKAAKDIHVHHAEDERSFSVEKMHTAHLYRRGRLSILGDYKGGVVLPKKLTPIVELNRLDNLTVHYSGFLVDNTEVAHYYLHTEHYNESANTVVSTLHELLTSMTRLPPDLALGFDSHSTNLNHTVVAYGKWLVSVARVFRSVALDYSVAGHGWSRMDQAHTPLWQDYWLQEAYNIVDLVKQCNTHKGHKGEIADTIFAWDEWFAPHVVSIPSIKQLHHIFITDRGVVTKQYVTDREWSSWRVNDASIEPLEVLISPPDSDYPKPLAPKVLSENKLKAIRKALQWVPNHRKQFLEAVSKGEQGIDSGLQSEKPKMFEKSAISAAATQPLPTTLTVAKIADLITAGHALPIDETTSPQVDNKIVASVTLPVAPSEAPLQLSIHHIVKRSHRIGEGVEDDAYRWQVELSDGARRWVSVDDFRTTPEKLLFNQYEELHSRKPRLNQHDKPLGDTTTQPPHDTGKRRSVPYSQKVRRAKK